MWLISRAVGVPSSLVTWIVFKDVAWLSKASGVSQITGSQKAEGLEGNSSIKWVSVSLNFYIVFSEHKQTALERWCFFPVTAAPLPFWSWFRSEIFMGKACPCLHQISSFPREESSEKTDRKITPQYCSLLRGCSDIFSRMDPSLNKNLCSCIPFYFSWLTHFLFEL